MIKSYITDCGNLTSPDNGDVTFSSTVYNQIAYYSCHSGYDRVGSSSRVCQKDAVWSATAPTCEIKGCMFYYAPNFEVVEEAYWFGHVRLWLGGSVRYASIRSRMVKKIGS